MDQIVRLEGARKMSGTAPDTQAEPAAASAPAEAVLPLDGRTLVFAALDRDTVVIAGAGDTFAVNLPVILNEDPQQTVSGTFVSFPDKAKPADGRVPFAAVLSLAGRAPGRIGRVTIRSNGRSHVYNIAQGPVEFAVLLAMVRATVPQTEMSIVDLLVDALFSERSAQANRQAAPKILQRAARADGFVEVLGGFDEGELYLQGWSRDLTAGASRVFAVTETLHLAELTCCLFERKDTKGKAAGFAGLLETGSILDTGSLKGLFFRGRSGWNRIDVHERCARPPVRSLPGQIRALLPGLGPSGDSCSRLEQAAQRFDGSETVSALDVPVRVGLDLSTAAEGAGLLLSGWLLDPEGHVEAVHLRSPSGQVRLDTAWTPQTRPDVTRAFEDLSPFLAGASASDRSSHRHGFLVFVPFDEIHPAGERAPSDSAYLEIRLKDGRSAYAPLALGKTSLRSAFQRLLAGLNPAVCSETDVVERQFLPMFQGAVWPEPKVDTVLDIGAVPETAPRALVIGLDEAVEKLRTLLPVLALDPFLKGTPLVLSGAAPVVSAQLQEIRRLAGFYAMAVRAVLANHVDDTLDALQMGMDAAPAATVVCLGAGVVPPGPGWLEPLMLAYQSRAEDCLVTPTLLYEDETIRWAGSWIEREDGAAALKQHYLGYPRRTVHGIKTREVIAAPFDCCVLPREAVAAVGGFARCYLGTDEKGMDATLRLRAKGLKSFWVPEVEMVHPEAATGGGHLWTRLAGEMDRRQFDLAWAGSLDSLKGET